MHIDNFAIKIREKINELQAEFEKTAEARRKEFRYRLERGRVVFEQGVAMRHRLMRMRLLKFLIDSKIGAVVTAPIIYSLIVPIVMLDLLMTIYQHVNFRVYRIPRVKRSDYVVMDRKYLAYLNIIQKINCIYCEYANGVIAYAREIASRTEQFWCPIKHARKVMETHKRYNDFLEYGDGENFGPKYRAQREKSRMPAPQGVKAPDDIKSERKAANDETKSAG